MTTQPQKKEDQIEADEKRYWLDDKNNVRKIYWALVVVCIALVAADAFYHKHVHYAFEGIFGFFGLFCFFLACCVRYLLSPFGFKLYICSSFALF